MTVQEEKEGVPGTIKTFGLETQEMEINKMLVMTGMKIMEVSRVHPWRK